MKNIGKMFVLSLVIAISLCFTQNLMAESNVGSGGNAQVRLDFEINIPTILYLQVGSTGATIDTVTFTVNDLPGTGAVAQDEAAIQVRVAGLIPPGQTMTLVADSQTSPPNDGITSIPFDEISWTAIGDFLGGTFNNTTNQQVAQFIGPGNRTGTYTFSYDHDTYYPANTYNGQVTYTLSAP